MSSPAVNVNPRLAALVAGRVQPVARPAAPLAHRVRRAAAHDRGGVAARRDLQPGDLREGDPRLRRLRRAARGARARRAPTAARPTARWSSATSRPPCDVFRAVYDETDHLDGYVSLEVEPDLAHDTEGTLTAARYYWERVDRPNLMIKIPGTPEGVPAIEEAIYEGINVNVTLLFARRRLHARSPRRTSAGWSAARSEGKGLDVHSVASFFVSRVDTEVDKRLEAIDATTSRASPASPTPATPTSASSRSCRPRDGARSARRSSARCGRRPASRTRATPTRCTSTSSSRPTRSTRCRSTTLHRRRRPRRRSSGDARRAGPEPRTCSKLARRRHRHEGRHRPAAREGVEKFVTPMVKLMAGIESKREAIVTHRPRTFDANLPDELEQAVAQAHRAGRARGRRPARLAARTRRCGAATPTTPELADRLGWLTVAERMQERARRPRGVRARRCSDAGLTQTLLLGMGGSSLAPEVFRHELRRATTSACSTAPTPTRSREAEQALDLDKTLFIVSSKSGGTIETLTPLPPLLGADRRQRRAVRRDHRPGLAARAARRASDGFRRVFRADPEIGGRYSALSHFGLVPGGAHGRRRRGAARRRAGRRARAAAPTTPARHNSGLWLGATLGELALRGRDKLTFVVDDPEIATHRPVARAARRRVDGQARQGHPARRRRAASAGPEVYGDDRVFVHLRGEKAELDDEMQGLAHAGQAVITIPTHGAKDLGRLFFFAEFATAVSGWALEHQPVRPAQRAGGQGQHASASRRGRARHPDRARSTTSLDGAAPPQLRRDPRLRRAERRRSTRRPPSCAGGSATSTKVDDDVRLRPALPALDRPVPQGRPGERARSCRSSTTTPDVEVPDEPFTFGSSSARRPPATCQTLAGATA